MVVKKPQNWTEATKESNPKDLLGCKKPSLSVIPWAPVYEAAGGMLEGACKYARHNYRAVGIRGSVYFDAALRHLVQWWEGEDIDPDSGVNHIGKALSCLLVMRDGMMQGKFIDDRPPKQYEGWMADAQKQVDDVLERYPEDVRKAPYTETGE